MAACRAMSSARPARTYSGLPLLVLTVLALTVAACGPAPGPGADPTGGPVSPMADPDAVTLAVVGDSITSPWGLLGSQEPDETMWLSHVVGPRVQWVGGWAFPGATTADMAASVDPVDGADVLVILAGTNDGASTPFEETARNLERIVETVGAPRVILSSVPPRAHLPHLTTRLNVDLEALAAAKGWEFVDAAAGLRSGEEWVEGMTTDGLHPTPQGQQVLGDAMREAILAGADG